MDMILLSKGFSVITTLVVSWHFSWHRPAATHWENGGKLDFYSGALGFSYRAKNDLERRPKSLAA
jgi:hypothetical protein